MKASDLGSPHISENSVWANLTPRGIIKASDLTREAGHFRSYAVVDDFLLSLGFLASSL